MFKITPVEDKTTQMELCTVFGTAFLAGDFCYLAANVSDDGSKLLGLLGLCQCYFSGEAGILHTITPFPGTFDEEVMIIMVRTAMSFLYRCGVQKVILSEAACDIAFGNKLGFRRDDEGDMTIDLKKFYASPCHYNKEHDSQKEEQS